MTRKYMKHGNSFKAKVALEAIKEKKTVADLCQEHGLSASQIFAWKKQLEEGSNKIFEDKQNDNHQEEIDRLHRVIGQLTAERDFLDHVLKR
jgi:transposase